MKSTKGVVVTQVQPGSPADKAKIEVGDVILEVEGEAINDENDIKSIFNEFRTGQVVTLKVLHNDKIVERKMKLEKR